MAFKDEHLDLFELSDRTLAALNEKGKFNLRHHDVAFHFSKDSNVLDQQLNFHIYLFGEEFGQTTYSKKYSTVDKMLKLLWSNLKNEYFYKDVREAVVMTKAKQLKGQLYETLRSIRTRMAELNDGSPIGVLLDVEEGQKKDGVAANGLPTYFITVTCRPKNLDFRLLLPSNASDYDQSKILESLENQLPATV